MIITYDHKNMFIVQATGHTELTSTKKVYMIGSCSSMIPFSGLVMMATASSATARFVWVSFIKIILFVTDAKVK